MSGTGTDGYTLRLRLSIPSEDSDVPDTPIVVDIYNDAVNGYDGAVGAIGGDQIPVTLEIIYDDEEME